MTKVTLSVRALCGLVGVGLAAAVTSNPALGNDQPYPIGEVAALMGGAAVAIVRDGSAPWYNPAGLGRAAEGISANVNAYGFQFNRASNFVDFGDGVTGDLTGTQVVAFPASVGYVKPLETGSAGRFPHAVGIAIVIPDYNKLEGVLTLPARAGAPDRDFYARERLLEQTYWVLPSWGGCANGRVCLGLAMPAAYRTSDGVYWVSGPTQAGTPASTFTYVEQSQTWTLGFALAFGVQWQVLPRLWLGATVRSPLGALSGGGNVLVFDSGRGLPGGSEPRRAEDQDLGVDHRVPGQLRFGVGWEGGPVRLAADLSLSLGLSRYARVRGANGAVELPSRPAGPPIPIARDEEAKLVANLNAGAQIGLGKRTSLLVGAFTDRSTRPRERVDELHPQIDRYGLTLGGGYNASWGTTYLGLIGTWASGTGYGVNPDGSRSWADTRAQSLLLTLGGSSQLGEDAPSSEAVASGEPVHRRWWFWAAFGAVVSAGLLGTLLGYGRDAIGAPLPE